jgi:hypothetical protein
VAAAVVVVVEGARRATATSHGSASFLLLFGRGQPGGHLRSSQAQLLEAVSYWLPTAVSGNVDGATNVGSYHLVCEAPGTQGLDGNAPAASLYVDDNGSVLDASSAATSFWVGVYPMQTG